MPYELWEVEKGDANQWTGTLCGVFATSEQAWAARLALGPGWHLVLDANGNAVSQPRYVTRRLAA